MFCNKKQCNKCGLYVELTLRNNETEEIKKQQSCVMMEILLRLETLVQDTKGLRQDTQSRGNEIVKGLSHAVMTNLKRLQ